MIFEQVRGALHKFNETNNFDDLPKLRVIDSVGTLSHLKGVYQVDSLSFQVVNFEMKWKIVDSFNNAQHFYKIMLVLDYLDRHLRSNQQVNKRSIYYSLVDQFQSKGGTS